MEARNFYSYDRWQWAARFQFLLTPPVTLVRFRPLQVNVLPPTACTEYPPPPPPNSRLSYPSLPLHEFVDHAPEGLDLPVFQLGSVQLRDLVCGLQTEAKE